MKWIVSPLDLPAQTSEDPPWYPTTAEINKVDISVLLDQERWGLVEDKIWTTPSLRVVITIYPSELHFIKGGHKKQMIWQSEAMCQLIQPVWMDYSKCTNCHDKWRGVTDGHFIVKARTQKGFRWNMMLPPTVTGKLGDKLEPTGNR